MLGIIHTFYNGVTGVLFVSAVLTNTFYNGVHVVDFLPRDS